MQTAAPRIKTDQVTAQDWTSLIEHAFWPVVVLVIVLALREQIGDFLSAISSRITKVSVMSVSVELAVATETTPVWRGVGGDDVRGLVPAVLVNDSYFDTLRQSLQVAGPADYFVVDLKSDGEEWLTTRLYLFSYLLGRLKGVRTVVFVATRGDVAGSFLGVGGTNDVMRALAAGQPWLRLARLEVEADQVGRLPDLVIPPPAPVPGWVAPVVPADVDEWWRGVATSPAAAQPLWLAQRFLQQVQWEQPRWTMDPEAGWLRLPDAPGRPRTWEHASWLASRDLTDGILRGAVQLDCSVVDDRSWSAENRVRAVARVPGNFVGLLGPTGKFERLIDRRSLLEALGAASTEP